MARLVQRWAPGAPSGQLLSLPARPVSVEHWVSLCHPPPPPRAGSRLLLPCPLSGPSTLWQVSRCPSLSGLSDSPVCGRATSIHLSVGGCRWPPCLTVTNPAAGITNAQLPLRDPTFNSFGDVPRSGVAGSMVTQFVIFLKDPSAAAAPRPLPTIGARGLVSPPSYRHLVSLVF